MAILNFLKIVLVNCECYMGENKAKIDVLMAKNHAILVKNDATLVHKWLQMPRALKNKHK